MNYIVDDLHEQYSCNRISYLNTLTKYYIHYEISKTFI